MATTQPKTNQANIDPRIQHPLARLRGTIRRYVTFEGLLIVGLFLALWYWLGMMFDYGLFWVTNFDWVVDAPKGIRVVLLIAAVAGLLALVVTRLVLRLTRDFSSKSLALVLEKRFPTRLGDRLITAVELADSRRMKERYNYSEEMIQETIRDAKERVEDLPVGKVFNWRRLWTRFGLLGALTLGVFLVISVTLILAFSFKTGRYLWKFSNVSTTWAKRNILLQDIPWDRDSYMEVIEPVEEDLAVGADKPKVTVRAIAYKWIVADSSAKNGWRPMVWRDLPDLVGNDAVPQLPLERMIAGVEFVRQQQAIRDAAKAEPKPGDDPKPESKDQNPLPDVPELPRNYPDAVGSWKVDHIEVLFHSKLKDTNQQAFVFMTTPFMEGGAMMAEGDLAKFDKLYERLEEMADDPGMNSKMRKLKVPAEAKLLYRDTEGGQKRGEIPAKGSRFNEYIFTHDLKETITYRIRGNDFSTPERKLTLVPQPSIIELKVNEQRPAYLYQLPPYKSDGSGATDPMLLKGKKQQQAEWKMSTTGHKSSITVFLGTNLTIEGESDKDLLSVTLKPTVKQFPGVETEEQAREIPLKLMNDGQGRKRKFSIRFRPDGTVISGWQKQAADLKDLHNLPDGWDPSILAVTRPTEFEVHLLDTHKVTSKRTFSIQISEDRGPEVSIALAGIRKVGAIHLCSANAMLPLTNDSFATDDYGLHRLEFVFSHTKIEQSAFVAQQMENLTWLYAAHPIQPSLGDLLYRREILMRTIPRLKAQAPTTVERVVGIPGFAEKFVAKAGREFNATGHSVKALDAKLAGMLPSDYEAPFVTRYTFGADREELFDLAKYLPELATQNPQDQAPYHLLLNVQATDSNVESGPRVALNKEPVVIKVVSYMEILSEVARDQSDHAATMEEVVRRLEAAQKNLNDILFRSGSGGKEVMSDLTIRGNTVVEDMGKANELLLRISLGYEKILEEYRLNRFEKYNPQLIPETRTLIVLPLQDVLKEGGLFSQADQGFTKVHNSVKQGNVPDAFVADNARQRMNELVDLVKRIQASMGSSLSLIKIKKQIDSLANEVRLNGIGIERIRSRIESEVFNFNLDSIPNVITVTAGKSTKLNPPIRVPEVCNDPPSLKFEVPPNTELKVTPGITKFPEQPRDHQFGLEITAGTILGKYQMKVIPSQGKGKEVTINIIP